MLCGWVEPPLQGWGFFSGAVSRYLDVEGELLGLLLALEKTRFWTLRCPDLMLCTDHKPLTGLVKTVGNPRVLRMLERMLRWRFSPTYLLGMMNRFPDPLSIYSWA